MREGLRSVSTRHGAKSVTTFPYMAGTGPKQRWYASNWDTLELVRQPHNVTFFFCYVFFIHDQIFPLTDLEWEAFW